VESQDVDIIVVNDIKSQSESHSCKVFVDISGNSCIFFLCWVLTNEQGLFWVIEGACQERIDRVWRNGVIIELYSRMIY